MPDQLAVPGTEGVRQRHSDDYYVTPAPCTIALCDELKRRGINPRTIVDVGCGDGAIGRVMRQAWPDSYIQGIDIDSVRLRLARISGVTEANTRGDYDAVWQGDWLDERITLNAELIVGNPAFKIALAKLRLALRRVRPGGHVAFLLPSQWDQETNRDGEGRARERGRFLDKLRLPNGDEGYAKLNYEGRVPFKGDKKTDRITYTWYGFGPGLAGVHSRIPGYSPDDFEQLALGAS